MVELAQWQARFAAEGVAVAAMTREPRAVSAAFHNEHQLPYSLLQDIDRKHFRAYGVINENVQPGDQRYGIPHPGILFINADGIVDSKLAMAGFKQRPSFESIYEAITTPGNNEPKE